MVDLLASDQAKDCREVFDLFDYAKEGLILSKKLGDALRALGMNPSRSEVEDMLNDINKNSKNASDKIEFNEFADQYAKLLKDPDTYEDLVESFRIFDVENKGYISKKHFVHIMEKFGDNVSKDDIKSMANKGDPNNEGIIKYHNFAKLLMELDN